MGGVDGQRGRHGRRWRRRGTSWRPDSDGRAQRGLLGAAAPLEVQQDAAVGVQVSGRRGARAGRPGSAAGLLVGVSGAFFAVSSVWLSLGARYSLIIYQ